MAAPMPPLAAGYQRAPRVALMPVPCGHARPLRAARWPSRHAPAGACSLPTSNSYSAPRHRRGGAVRDIDRSAGDRVQSRDQQFDRARAGEHADARRPASPRAGALASSAPCTAMACAAYSIATGGAEPAVSAQRMIGQAMAAGAAADRARDPRRAPVQQTHAPLLRYVRGDPAAVQPHGSNSSAGCWPMEVFEHTRGRRAPAPAAQQRQRASGRNREPQRLELCAVEPVGRFAAQTHAHARERAGAAAR